MTKHRKSRHRIPVLVATEPVIDDAYQAEIDQSIARLEAKYRKAKKALAAAELKAERARVHADNLARKQADAQLVAENRLRNEQRLSEFIERIKDAAKNSRVTQARADLERRRREAVDERNAETVRRKTEAKMAREREALIKKQRDVIRAYEGEVFERRRELNEIKLLMMPTNYAGRDHRKGGARHVSG